MQQTLEGTNLAVRQGPGPLEGEDAETPTFSWSGLLADLSTGLNRLAEAASADLEALQEVFPTRPAEARSTTDRRDAGLKRVAEEHRGLREKRLQPALRRLDSAPPGRRLWLALERMTRTLERTVDRIPDLLSRTNPCLEGLPGSPIRERQKARPMAAREVARGQISALLEQLNRQARKVVIDLDMRALKGLQDWRRECLALDQGLLAPLVSRAALRSMRARAPKAPLARFQRLIRKLQAGFPARLRHSLLANRAGKPATDSSRQRLRTAMEVASTELALEAELERLWDGLEGLLAGLIVVADREDSACRHEARELTRVLQDAAQDGTEQQVAVPATVLTGAARHLENLARKAADFAQTAPEDLVRATAGQRPLQFHSAPTAEFLRAFQAAALPRLQPALEHMEARILGLSCEAQRARELLEYSRDSEGFQTEVSLASEALLAQALNLERMEASLPPARSSLSPLAAEVLASVTWEIRLVMDRCPRMAADFRMRLGFQRLYNRLESLAQTTAQAGLQRSWQALKNESHQALINLGWIPATTEGHPRVELRPTMPGHDGSTLARSALTAPYRRLFRPIPVEDPRFLVGRHLELEALGQARAAWEAGRPTAVMIRGARGSGKSSLLNCALKSVLEGLPVLRIQPQERICSEAGLQEWLQAHPLSGTRQVVILEEAERLYLRRIGGFEAIEGLLRTVHSTCPEVLWIVVLDMYAARLLQATSRLESAFTHRLRAETVGPAQLREAVMVRHRLSGLRLRFLDGETRKQARNRWLGGPAGTEDPESLFFADLHQRSGGVFRSALEIYLDSIEPAERGALTVKPLGHSDLTDVVNDLNVEGHFTLVAVLQHGSLTASEHAEVFGLPVPASQACLLDLTGRRLLEEDPDHPGFRVRPEARPPVRQVLFRLNLL